MFRVSEQLGDFRVPKQDEEGDGGNRVLNNWPVLDADSDFIAAWMAEAFFGSDYGPVNLIGRRVRCTHLTITRRLSE